MKTIHLNYLLSTLSLLLIFGCVTDKKSSVQLPIETRNIESNTRIEVCQNCHVTFKTSLLAQKSQDPNTAGLCPICSAEYHKHH